MHARLIEGSIDDPMRYPFNENPTCSTRDVYRTLLSVGRTASQSIMSERNGLRTACCVWLIDLLASSVDGPSCRRLVCLSLCQEWVRRASSPLFSWSHERCRNTFGTFFCTSTLHSIFDYSRVDHSSHQCRSGRCKRLGLESSITHAGRKRRLDVDSD